MMELLPIPAIGCMIPGLKLCNYNRVFKKWCHKAGIDPLKAHWHILRHTYIVQSKLKGRAVQQQTGDSEVTILRVFSTLTPEERVRDAQARPILPMEVKKE